MIFSQTMLVDTSTPRKEEILRAYIAYVAPVVWMSKLPDLVYLIFDILLKWDILSIISECVARGSRFGSDLESSWSKNIKVTISFLGSHIYKILNRSWRSKKICIAESRFACFTNRAVCYHILFIILICFGLLNNTEPLIKYDPRSESWNMK